MVKKQIVLLYFVLVTLKATSACVHHLQRSVSVEEIREQAKRGPPTSPMVKTAIENVRVWDDGHFTEPQTITIDNGIITDSSNDIKKTINGAGQYLIPGLMDSHCHITDLQGLINMTSYGVTTAFNMACRDYAACDMLRNNAGLASFLFAGVPAVGPGSQHSQLFKVPPSLLTYPNATLTEFVEWSFGNSSNYYKIVSEPNGPTKEQQAELVNATHAFSKLSMTHAAQIQAYMDAVASGSDGIQHVPPEGLLQDSTIQDMIEQGQFSTPTMEIFRQAFAKPEILAFVAGNSSTPWTWANVEQNVKALRAANVPILAGTDAVGPVGQGINIPFGSTLHDELQNFVAVGFSPAEALNAATIVPAKHFGLDDRGLIAIGKRADLLLLNADPLADISNTRDIAKIWVGGVEVREVKHS